MWIVCVVVIFCVDLNIWFSFVKVNLWVWIVGFCCSFVVWFFVGFWSMLISRFVIFCWIFWMWCFFVWEIDCLSCGLVIEWGCRRWYCEICSFKFFGLDFDFICCEWWWWLERLSVVFVFGVLVLDEVILKLEFYIFWRFFDFWC